MKKPYAGLAFEYSETQVSVPKADANLGHPAPGCAVRARANSRRLFFVLLQIW